jgi:hypothetical protein
LRTHISDKEIHDYNEALPSEETLKKYIRQYMEFKRVQDFGVAVTVYINNLGTTKATDISATIEFPDEVRVYDVTKVEDMKAPEAPGKPEDLFQKAYMRAHRSEMAFMNAMGQIDTDIFQVRPSVHLSDLSRFTRQTGMDEFFLIEDNIVEIEDKSGIVHTKSDWYRGCYLVALQPGEYMAKVTMMCAEYENPEVAYIKFVCEE